MIDMKPSVLFFVILLAAAFFISTVIFAVIVVLQHEKRKSDEEKRKSEEQKLRSHVNELKKETEEQSHRIEALHSRLDEKKEEILRQNLQIADMELEIDKRKSQILALVAARDQFKKENVGYKSKISDMQDEIDGLERDLANLRDIGSDSIRLAGSLPQLPTPDENENLNIEKRKLFAEIQCTNDSFLITGKAGTGKSFLLRYIVRHLKRRILLCAPTGIAALNIHGETLHSAFGFANLTYNAQVRLSQNQIELFRKIDVLLIDEISMVRSDVMTQIDKILQTANKDQHPFGGKQLLLFGDLFQLPPVAKTEEEKRLTEKYGGINFFDAPAYKRMYNLRFRELTEVFRQDKKTQGDFIAILDRIRDGSFSSADIKKLNERVTDAVPDRIIRIVPTKNKAGFLNRQALERLHENEFIFEASVEIFDDKKSEDLKETDFPCEFKLKLRVGAIVMMISNDLKNKRWVNGTLGIVSGLGENKLLVTIDGTAYRIDPVPFETFRCRYDEEQDQIRYEPVASVKQYPVIPAYAITIHKSQGMTYNEAECDLAGCFAPGQAYVALSRCRSYEGLYLTERVTSSSILVNEAAKKYYDQMHILNSQKTE